MPKKVLIVDDDENIRRFLTVALEENGYEAATAADGDDGLQKVEESIPDLILLDLMMPKKTGFTLFKQLRKNEEYKGIPVIMLTGVAEALEEDGDRAESDTLESPYDSLRDTLSRAIAEMREEGLVKPEVFIDKPIDPEDLIAAVRDLIGS